MANSNGKYFGKTAKTQSRNKSNNTSKYNRSNGQVYERSYTSDLAEDVLSEDYDAMAIYAEDRKKYLTNNLEPLLL